MPLKMCLISLLPFSFSKFPLHGRVGDVACTDVAGVRIDFPSLGSVGGCLQESGDTLGFLFWCIVASLHPHTDPRIHHTGQDALGMLE